MPDRIEGTLRELGRALEYPQTPDFAATIADEVRSRPRRRRAILPARPLRRSLALAGATLLVAAATVLAASPGARDAVLEFFGLRGATVEVVPRLPDVPADAERLPPPGVRMSLPEARRRVAFPVLTAPGGTPREIRVSDEADGGVVTFEQRGLLVTQFRGRTEREFLGKLVAEGTRVERLRVAGGRAIWLEGRPHVVFLRDSTGATIEHSLRRAGNVLLFERDGLLVRIEGARSRAAAIEFARSLA